MKPSETTQIEFIKDCLRNGDKRAAILRKFGKKWENISRTTFDRRLKLATAALQDELRSVEIASRKKIEEEVNARALKTLTYAERLDILTKIALGEIEIPSSEVKWDTGQRKFVKIPVMEQPNHVTRIKAIEEINKMTRGYTPVEIHQKTSLLPCIIDWQTPKDTSDSD